METFHRKLALETPSYIMNNEYNYIHKIESIIVKTFLRELALETHSYINMNSDVNFKIVYVLSKNVSHCTHLKNHSKICSDLISINYWKCTTLL